MDSKGKDSIRAILAEYDQVCAVGDAAAYAALYTDDAVLLPPNAPIVEGRPAIENWAKEVFKDMLLDVVAKDADIIITGDWAIVRGTYSATFTPKEGGVSIEDAGKWLVVMSKQQDGLWKYAHNMWSRDK